MQNYKYCCFFRKHVKLSLDSQRNIGAKNVRCSVLLGFKQLCHFLNHYNELGIHFTLALISNNKECDFQEYVLFVFKCH